MRKRSLTFVLCAAVFAAGVPSVDAGDKKPTGAEKKAATQSLYGITWYKSVDDALKAAQKSSSPRPVFVWRMLGDLCGKT